MAFFGAKARLLHFGLLLALCTLPAISVIAPVRVAAQEAAQSLSYSKMFEYSRDLLSRKPVRDFLRETFKEELILRPEVAAQLKMEGALKEVSETQLMLLLEKNPQLLPEIDKYLAEIPKIDLTDSLQDTKRKAWREKFRALIKDQHVREEFQKLNNPAEAYLLRGENGKPAYTSRRLYVNHERMSGTKLKPADDLKKVVRDFIGNTQKQLIMNFFDFDLMDVADDLVELAKQGKDIQVGIDAGVIEARPEVMAVRDRLREGGVFVHEVDSVGLNHQKIIATDWEIPGKGRALLSSGNLTQSCIGPEGDLVHLNPRPRFSVPNANHMIVLDSDALSQLLQHNMSMTIKPGLQLRGSQYPMGGSYKLMGPIGKDGKQTHMLMTFTPGGALKNVNKNMIARVLRETEGPIHMAQFAYSSNDVNDALLERAAKEIKRTGRFQFFAAADTSFSVQPWSGFLKMTGQELQKEGDIKRYVELPDSPWRKTLGEKQLAELRKTIRIAPREYGTNRVRIGEEVFEATGKLHHKMLISGDAAVMGTSFNFSTGAETNQEQLAIFFDREMANDGRGIVEALAKNSERSVFEETQRRNMRNDFGKIVDDPDVDKPVKRAPAAVADKKSGSKPVKSKGKTKCKGAMKLVEAVAD